MSIQRLGAGIIGLLMLCAGSAQSQFTAPAGPDSTPASASGEHRGVWRKLAGESAGSALYSGWWTLHLRNTRKGIRNNHFWGATVRGFNAGTFVTSYGDRAWEATVERTWLSGRAGATSARLGYRAGLLYGYDAELLPIAGRVPVLPMME